MENEVISYLDMCQREGVSLQQGMNFRLGHDYSVILMSVQKNAPYRDVILEDGTTLIYEGHDLPRTSHVIDPKQVDQPQYTATGNLTANGKFHQAAQQAKAGRRLPERVRVYEKIRSGIWSYNGLFSLEDSWIQHDGHRNVFKFRLEAIAEEAPWEATQEAHDIVRRRIIPTAVKLEVWQRDGGKCVVCGAKDELHFDHIIPYARGGTSMTAANVQLLCARHNIAKRDRIE